MKKEKIIDNLIKGAGILSILYLAATILVDDQPHFFSLVFLILMAGAFIIFQIKKEEHDKRVRIIYDLIILIILMLLFLGTVAITLFKIIKLI